MASIAGPDAPQQRAGAPATRGASSRTSPLISSWQTVSSPFAGSSGGSALYQKPNQENIKASLYLAETLARLWKWRPAIRKFLFYVSPFLRLGRDAPPPFPGLLSSEERGGQIGDSSEMAPGQSRDR